MFGEVQKQAGGSIKHDVSVPVAAVPAFIAEASEAAVKLIPGARPLPFGHLGDGNIHYNVAQPAGADKAAYLERWHDMNEVVFAVVKKFGGSISAEHGIGVMKRDLLPSVKDPVAFELMRTLKRTLDPQGHPQSRQGAVAATCSLTPASHLSPEGPHGRSGLPANFLRPIAALSAPIFFFAVTRKTHRAPILLQSRNTRCGFG